MSKILDARLVNSGMGGFLDAPGYPTHHWSIEYDRRQSCCSIVCAAENPDAYPHGVVMEVAHMICEWRDNRPPLDSGTVREWVKQVLGYFKNCYRNHAHPEPECWHASNMLVQPRDPMAFVDDHAGVRQIRKFYPEFVPTAEDFADAKWGT